MSSKLQLIINVFLLAATMRRLRDDECPLALCLSWTADGLNFHRFVLQENDTGEIMVRATWYTKNINIDISQKEVGCQHFESSLCFQPSVKKKMLRPP